MNELKNKKYLLIEDNCNIIKGLYAETKLYKNIENDDEVIIKKYDKTIIIKEHFNEKRKILNDLQSEYTTKLIEDFEDSNYYYMVLEKCDTNLKFLIQNKSIYGLPVEIIQKIFIQINNVINKMIQFNYYIRELNLENILIKYTDSNKINFNIKLGDFAISKNYYNFYSKSNLKNKAPEIDDYNFSSNSILWNLGCLLYEMYFNEYIFEGKDEEETKNNKNSAKIKKSTKNDEINNLIMSTIILDEEKRIKWNEYINNEFFLNFKNFMGLREVKLIKYKIKNKENKINKKQSIFSIKILYDKRLIASSNDNLLLIYNNETFKIDFMIKFKNDYSINYIYSFKNENKIITCNDNSTLKIIKIDKNEHKILQTLKAHEKEVYKVINLNNNNLCSCSNDETIRIWEKQNDLYNNVFTLKGDKYIEDILEIKNNIIVSSSAWDYSLIFWDLNKKERIKKLNNIICFYWNNILCKINEDFLLVGGIGSIYLINLNNYDINKFDCEENNILCLCKINEKYFFSGDNRGNLKQWKFNGKTIKIINNKENSHNKDINEIILNDENIITCSSDNKIKIWE